MPLDLEQMSLSGFEPNPNLNWWKIADTLAPDGVDDTGRYEANLIPVPIDEHRILVIDQANCDNSVRSSFVRVFDVRERKWSEEKWPCLNEPRSEFSAVTCNGKVYVIGGVINGETTDKIECLDLAAMPRQWQTMNQRLIAARSFCNCPAIEKRIYILGGDGVGAAAVNLLTIEILDTETGELYSGPDMPPGFAHTGAVVDNTLVVFSYRKENNEEKGEMHSFQDNIPALRWKTSPITFPKGKLSCDTLVIGQCVVPASNCVYDTKRERWWELPVVPFPAYELTTADRMEIIAFTNDEVYSLKLKPNVRPPTATIPSRTKKQYDSLLSTPDFGDVIFVCPDGTEIAAHKCILSVDNPYFHAYFSGPWTQQHPNSRWETEKSPDVMKALLSLIYTGEVSLAVDDMALLGLLEGAYEFQLNDDLIRVCQSKCIENISKSNVKDLLLSAKLRGASFLFEACFNFVCEHFSEDQILTL